MRHIDDIDIKEKSDTLQEALAKGDKEAARQAAREITRLGELSGPRAARKTQLARQALQELNAEGRLTRRTQLNLDDAVRTAEVPEPEVTQGTIKTPNDDAPPSSPGVATPSGTA
jgi:hypothetical protein